MSINVRILVVLYALLVSSAQSSMLLFVAKTGNDSNDCLSAATACLTIQAAVNKVPMAGQADISVAAGTYPEAVNVYYWRGVTIHGPDPLTCGEPQAGAVVVGVPGGIAITADDHVIVVVNCLTVIGSTGLYSRQLAILDYLNVKFLSQTAVTVNDNAVASCANFIWVRAGGSSVFSAATGVLNVNCNVQISDGLAFTAFVIASDKAVARLGGMAVPGITMNGQKWFIVDATLHPPQAPYVIPGTGSTELYGAIVY